MFYIPWERELLAKELLPLKPPLELPVQIQLIVEQEQARKDLRELSKKQSIHR
jgi:hypothetical protein